MTMTITNKITVSAFEKKSFSHLVFVCFLFSQQTISHSDNEERGEDYSHHASFVQKTHTLAHRIRQRDQSKTTHTKIQKTSDATTGLCSGAGDLWAIKRFFLFLSIHQRVRNLLSAMFQFAWLWGHSCCVFSFHLNVFNTEFTPMLGNLVVPSLLGNPTTTTG